MKNKISFSAPTSRSEFERNLFLIKEKIVQGKLSIFQGNYWAASGLLRARELPNGRIDLLSIDESTRSLANTMANLEEQDQS